MYGWWCVLCGVEVSGIGTNPPRSLPPFYSQMKHFHNVPPIYYIMGQVREKFGYEPWCKEGDWVCIGRYAGSRFQIEGGEVRIINDDEVIATIIAPDDIKSYGA